MSISGKRRGKINSGYLQCPVGFSEDGNGDFIILNADTSENPSVVVRELVRKGKLK